MTGDRLARAASSAETRALLAAARRIIQQVVILIRNSYLHEPSNQVFDEPIERLQAEVAEAVQREGSLDFEVVSSEIYVGGVRLRLDLRNLHTYKYFVDEISSRGLGGLRFEAVPERTAIGAFLRLLLGLRRSDEDASADANRRLGELGVAGISTLPPRREVEPPSTDRRQRAIDVYQQALDFIRSCMTELDSPAQVNLREAKRLVHRLVDLSYEEGEGFSMLGLAAIKSHDEYTFNHMVNVCVLAVAFGQRLGLPRRELAQLGLCALYHDLGKLDIPIEILGKHGPLDDREWAVMGNHPVFGAREIFTMGAQDRDALLRVLVALQHHIGWDGRGYPPTRLLSQPNLYARIVAIVDAFDAMTTKRVYQDKRLPDEALAEIQKVSGTKYDPLLVKAFITCVGIYPVGSTVLLTDGRIGVVREPDPDPSRLNRPKVRVATDMTGRELPDEVVDLASPEHASRAIVRTIDPEDFGINAAHYAV